MVAGIAIGLAVSALLAAGLVFWLLVRVADDMATKLQAMVDRDEQQEWDD